MSATFIAACVQNSAGNDVAANIAETTTMIRAAHAAGAALVCLPENVTCIEPDDPAGLARGAVRLLRNARMREEMARAGRAFVNKRFSMERMVADTLASYERLLTVLPRPVPRTKEVAGAS